MPEITKATCKVCGKEFEGEDCYQKALLHEQIPVPKVNFEKGDIVVTVFGGGQLTVHLVETHAVSMHEHEITYNSGYSFNTTGILIAKNDGKISKKDLMFSPDFIEVREKMLSNAFDTVLKDLDTKWYKVKIKE